MRLVLAFIILAISSPFAYADFQKGVKILPHRAVYKVSLKSSDDNSSIQDTNGQMVIELENDCEGWTLRQESATFIDSKDNYSDMVRSKYVAWESNDSKTLHFYTERVFNEGDTEVVQGSAGFTDKGGLINFTTPDAKNVFMKKGTLPPIQHMRELLHSAQSGKKLNSQSVFDGSFFGNPVQINTFIGKQKQTCGGPNGPKTNTGDVYPMSLAVYSLPSNGSNPNFEISQNIDENGVICGYTINFGDYTVQGKLETLEYLPKSGVCLR